MSNLGAYQMVTTGIKAMGGPAKAGVIAVGCVAALMGSAFRFGVNCGVNMVIVRLSRRRLLNGCVQDSLNPMLMSFLRCIQSLLTLSVVVV